MALTEPSKFIERQASFIDEGLPILDAPCGFRRNSLFLAEQGYEVIGVDIDRERIRSVASRARSDPRVEKNLTLAICDLNAGSLPFMEASFGALVIVHFIPERWNNYLT